MFLTHDVNSHQSQQSENPSLRIDMNLSYLMVENTSLQRKRFQRDHHTSDFLKVGPDSGLLFSANLHFNSYNVFVNNQL